jgi:membrane-associated phospholipid phosphatase
MLIVQSNWDHVFPFDAPILDWAANYRSGTLDQFFQYVTWNGSLNVLLPITMMTVAVLLRLRLRNEANFIALSLSGATFISHLLKALLARPRPALFEPLVSILTSGSFPSAHTTQITAFAFCLFLIVRRTWPGWQPLAAAIAVVLVATVAASRVYLQVHFPSDVLAGAILGMLCVIVAHRVSGHRPCPPPGS